MVFAEQTGQEATVLSLIRRRRVELPGGHCVQQVGAADDADHPPVTHDRHALDVMDGEQPGNLADTGLLRDRHQRCRHDIARRAIRRPQTGLERAVQSLTFR